MKSAKYSPSPQARYVVQLHERAETHFITLAVVLLLSTYKSKKLIDIQGLDWLETEKQQVMEK